MPGVSRVVFKGVPSRIGILLDMSLRELERILYFESYVVIDPREAGLKERELLTEERYRELVKDQDTRVFWLVWVLKPSVNFCGVWILIL